MKNTCRILFVDGDNCARSLMAEAWFNFLGSAYGEACSCGIEPGKYVDPLAAEVMAEVGLDIRSRAPKSLDLQSVADVDLIILMDFEVYPSDFSPREVWDLADPTGRPIEDYRDLRDGIQALVKDLILDLETNALESHVAGLTPSMPL